MTLNQTRAGLVIAVRYSASRPQFNNKLVSHISLLHPKIVHNVITVFQGNCNFLPRSCCAFCRCWTT